MLVVLSPHTKRRFRFHYQVKRPTTTYCPSPYGDRSNMENKVTKYVLIRLMTRTGI